MEQWPATLPVLQRAGFSVKDSPNLITTPMEAGPARVESVAADFGSELKGKTLLTAAQAKTLRNFHRVNINNGADWFEMSVDSGGGYALHQVRIKKGQMQLRQRGLMWELSLTLEIIARPVTA